MKFITVGFLIFNYVASSWCLTKEEGMEMARALINECKNQEGGSVADVELLLNMKFSETREGKCMVSCVHEKMGIIKDGAFNRKNFVLLVKMATDGHDKHDEYMKLGDELADICGNIGGERCEQAIEFDKCMEKEIKARNLKIPFI